jgi:hypothetical protein
MMNIFHLSQVDFLLFFLSTIPFFSQLLRFLLIFPIRRFGGGVLLIFIQKTLCLKTVKLLYCLGSVR